MKTLILIFLKIGFLGFGGGYAMLSLIFADARKLGITTQQFADLNALDFLAPGPIAVNSATYVGFITYGFTGAVAATLAVCTSSFVFSSLLLKYEATFFAKPVLAKFLNLTKIAALGMIIAVALNLLFDALIPNSLPLISLAGISIAVIGRFKYKLNTLLVLALAGGAGALLYFMS